MFDAKNALFCLKKLRLRHFCRECRENLNIRVLRTKFWVKSACEDDPQVVPACSIYYTIVYTIEHLTVLNAFHPYVVLLAPNDLG